MSKISSSYSSRCIKTDANNLLKRANRHAEDEKKTDFEPRFLIKKNKRFHQFF